MFVSACAEATDSTSGPRPLQEVSLPDISSAAEPVQQQIRERYSALQAVRSQPNTPFADLAHAFGDMGKLLLAAEYFDAADACFANASALAPGDMRWPYLRGHVFRVRNDSAKAIESFERTLAISPDHVPTLVWLADLYLTHGRAEAAEPLLARARSLDPASGAVLFGLGRAALARQDYASAVTHLEGALSSGAHATAIHYPLALAYRGLGNRARAEEHLRQRGEVHLAPADPLLEEVASLLQNAAAYETRGSRAIEARDWPEAMTNLRKAVDLDPDNALTRLNLGTALYMQNDSAGALEQYRAAIRLSPSLAKAHFGIGVVMESRGMDREAIDAFTTAVTHDPQYLEARFNLANALRRVGRVKESLPHYDAVVRANAAVSQAHFGYAMGLVRLRRYQEARARLEDAVTTFPDQPGFVHALARLLAAAPDDRVRDGARALSIMNGLMKAQQTLAMAETMAMALAELQRFDEAVEWQQRAIAAAAGEKRDDLVRALSVNLRLYQERRPCRTPWTDDDPVHRPTPSS